MPGSTLYWLCDLGQVAFSERQYGLVMKGVVSGAVLPRSNHISNTSSETMHKVLNFSVTQFFYHEVEIMYTSCYVI